MTYRCKDCAPSFEDEGSGCFSRSEIGYYCTREANHEGDHVACGAVKEEHPITTWPQKSEHE